MSSCYVIPGFWVSLLVLFSTNLLSVPFLVNENLAIKWQKQAPKCLMCRAWIWCMFVHPLLMSCLVTVLRVFMNFFILEKWNRVYELLAAYHELQVTSFTFLALNLHRVLNCRWFTSFWYVWHCWRVRYHHLFISFLSVWISISEHKIDEWAYFQGFFAV